MDVDLTAADAAVPFCYVTTTGRRSGRSHTIEIWFAGRGATVYIGTFPSSDTVRNARVNAAVTVRVGDVTYPATARFPEPGTDEDARARRALVDKYQSPGASDLESWGRSCLVVAFDLSAPSGP